ncbi:MAG: fenitrothion hydrolase [Thermoleophilia bacterium]|nr:fenitrothion hydrolase [Thermoleophilia bacterium]
MTGLVVAHGLSGRADLPIPAWLVGWAATGVLVVSFMALAALWTSPRLGRTPSFRPLPAPLSSALTSRPVETLCGLAGVFLLAVLVWAGLFGVQSTADNAVPTFVYVTFWIGLVPVSVLAGDVFRAFNPWRAIGRAGSWAASRLAGERLGSPLPYPGRLGRWPAVAGLVAFAWLELISPNGTEPRTVAAAALAYTAVTILGMGVYGVEPWLARGEAFSAYFGAFARFAPIERRGRQLGLRPPLAGLPGLEPLPGTVALLAVMIGSVTFDGFQETDPWSSLGPRLSSGFDAVGASPGLADELAAGFGLAAAIAIIAGFFMLGVAGARAVGGDTGTRALGRLFAHSLVPIALVYAGAHYLTFLLFQGQALGRLVSDPAGRGWDLFGTAGWTIDYGLIGATTTWYVQVSLVVAGHLAALVLAHDRALALHDDPRLAARSQRWLLAVMVGFTGLALWLLSQANA